MGTTEYKTYSELVSIPTYEGRFRYLKLDGLVGFETFGSRRLLNQSLYTSQEWKRFRRGIIIRDSLNGDHCCDLAFPGKDIGGNVLIHHLNPITAEDIINRSPSIFDPENVVCVAFRTHEAIHYGDESLLMKDPVVRSPNDTCPWR